MKIIGVGDNMVDVYLHQNKMYPGGNSVNVPVLARRAGAEKAAYIGIFGDDPAGKLMMDALTEEGLELSRVRILHGSNAKNAITLDKENDRIFAGNNYGGTASLVELKFSDEDIEYIAGYDVLYTSVHSEIPYLLPLVKGKLFIAMDFSDGFTDQRIEELCPYLDLAFFTGSQSSKEEIEQTIVHMLKAGTKMVVVTMGMEGSIVTDGKEKIFQAAIKANEPVVDSLGAGDTYAAGFLQEYFTSSDMRKAALNGAQFALTTLKYYGAFGHGTEADVSGLVMKDDPNYKASRMFQNRFELEGNK